VVIFKRKCAYSIFYNFSVYFNAIVIYVLVVYKSEISVKKLSVVDYFPWAQDTEMEKCHP